MTLQTDNSLAKQEDGFTKKEILFINEYVRTGNATQSYIKIYKLPKSKYHSATVRACNLKSKISNIDEIYFERAGLNVRLISNVLKQALKAKKPVIYKGIHEYPDHTTRLRAVEVYDKMVNKEENKDNQPTIMTGLKIIIQK